MLRIVLVLQVLILLLFGFFILNIQNTVNELSGQLETALLTIEDMKTVLPEIEEAVENFNQLEPLFENLGKLSELLSVLTDPFGSNGKSIRNYHVQHTMVWRLCKIEKSF